MAARLIAGRAGSGKSHHCLMAVCDELTRSRIEGPRLLLVVPEQAGLQMERALLSMLTPSALGRCEVTSFRRLAHRILNETTGPSPVPLSSNGRQMALRTLIAQNRRQFQEFGAVADRSGFLASAARGIVELIQEAVTPEQLEAAAASAETDGDLSAPRLADMALLYRAYLNYLGSERVDPEAVLDLARARLSQLSWPDGARVWIDGFAGLTQQQIRMVTTLAHRASSLDIALLIDPARRLGANAEESHGELSLFARTERTWFGLARALREEGVAIDNSLMLEPSPLSRFKSSPMLVILEGDLFSGERRADDSARGEEGTAFQRRDESSVHFIVADDRRQEVEAAVTALVDLIQTRSGAMRYRDVALVMRDLANYHDIISDALAARGIPFFIDRRRPTIHHPIVQLVRGLLAMQDDAAFDQCAAIVLKTGLSGIPEDSAQTLENYALAHGMTSAELWWEEWTLPPNPARAELVKTPAGAELLTEVNGARRNLMAKLSPLLPQPAENSGSAESDSGVRSKPRHIPCKNWIKDLLDVMERMEVRATLSLWCEQAILRGDLDESREHQQVWADFSQLLAEAAEALGTQPMTGRQFRDVVEAGLADFTVGLVPATLDQVLVSSIERSRHPPVRAVFVLGFGEGEFPSRAAEDAIFTDEDRARLEESGVALGQTRIRRLLDERMLAYIAFTRPSEFLWVSYPQADEAGKSLSPSPYWQDLRRALPDVPIIDAASWLQQGSGTTTKASEISSVGQLASGIASAMRAWAEGRLEQGDEFDAWHALYEWSAGHDQVQPAVAAALTSLRAVPDAMLSSAATKALWRSPHRTSVTALEQFARCPFRHFAGYGLRLEPRAEHEISSIDLGRMYHTILEQYVNELNESNRSLRDVTPEAIAGDISRLSREVVPKYAEEMRMDPGRQRGLIWRTERELPAASLGQKKSLGVTSLTPAATELAFADGVAGALPSLKLSLSGERVVEIRGKIDRIDLLTTGDRTMGIVFDYKRSFGKSLRLEEVYHGLALQLLAYLLVLREHGDRLASTKVVPGGAFYLPLLSRLESVDHPSEADEASFNALKGFRPRGVVDFDWIDQLDPSKVPGWSEAFSVFRTSEGEPGHLDLSDAAPSGMLKSLIDHVRDEMVSLCEKWLSGDIAVSPILLGTYSPCTDCLYRSVCRVERITMYKRRVDRKRRTDVLAELGWTKEVPDKSSAGRDGQD